MSANNTIANPIMWCPLKCGELVSEDRTYGIIEASSGGYVCWFGNGKLEGCKNLLKAIAGCQAHADRAVLQHASDAALLALANGFAHDLSNLALIDAEIARRAPKQADEPAP